MIFNIKVKGRIATYIPGDEEAVCGNDGDQIKFELDEEWAAIDPKTARFKHGTEHHDVEFSGDTCNVPYFEDVNKVYVGLYSGEKGAAEPRHSTTDTLIPYKYSSRCGASTPAPASGENYTNEAKGAAAEAKAAAAEATAAAETIGELKDDMRTHGWRISKLEREAKRDDKLAISTDGTLLNWGGLILDDGLPYLIHVLGGQSTWVEDPNDYGVVNGVDEMYGVIPKPSYVCKVEVGMAGLETPLLNLPAAEGMQEICPFLGYGKHTTKYGKSFVSDNFGKYENFIFFEDGKAYYYQGCEYIVGIDVYVHEQNGRTVVDAGYTWDGCQEKCIVGLEEPIITDISEYIRYAEGNERAGEKFDGYCADGVVEYDNMTLMFHMGTPHEIIYHTN